MKGVDMNTVIAWGLVAMGTLAIGGWIAISVLTGTSSGTEVPIAIVSGLTGVLTGKNLARVQASEPPQESQANNVTEKE